MTTADMMIALQKWITDHEIKIAIEDILAIADAIERADSDAIYMAADQLDSSAANLRDWAVGYAIEYEDSRPYSAIYRREGSIM